MVCNEREWVNGGLWESEIIIKQTKDERIVDGKMKCYKNVVGSERERERRIVSSVKAWAAVEASAWYRKKREHRENPIWTGFELMAREFVFFFQLGLLDGRARANDDDIVCHFWSINISQQSILCSLAHSLSFSLSFFIGLNSVFVCTFDIEIAFWLSVTHHLSLYLYWILFPWSVTLARKYFY